MKRWLLDIVATFSLLLAMVVIVLWVRGYWIGDQLSRQGNGDVAIRSSSGYLQLYFQRAPPRDDKPAFPVKFTH